jgi:hypothetical protein
MCEVESTAPPRLQNEKSKFRDVDKTYSLLSLVNGDRNNLISIMYPLNK